MNARWSFPFILALSLALPRTSLADKGAAVLLYDEAERLMAAKRMSEACPKFGESYRLDPQIGVLLHLADCQEQIGKLASAWSSFREAGDLAEKLGDPRAAEARGYATALEKRLPRLTVTVSEGARVPGLEVRREGQTIGEPLWGSGVPVDPGEHQVEASAPGKKPWSSRVTVATEGQLVALEIPPLEAAPMPDGAVPPMVPGTPVTADVGVPTAGAPLRTIGLVVGGVGVVGLGLGGYFGLRAKSLNDESKEGGHCTAQNECDTAGGAKRDDAIGAANIATVAFIAGGVLTVTGVTLFLVGGPKEKNAASVEAAPVAGQGIAGLTVRGAF